MAQFAPRPKRVRVGLSLAVTALVVPSAFVSVRTGFIPSAARVESEHAMTALLGNLVEAKPDAGDEVSQRLVDALRTGPDLEESATADAPWEDAPFDPLRDVGYGIPGPVLDAYLRADRALAKDIPGCGLHWSYLAGIGKVESNHARGQVDAHGTTPTPILGPVLSGGPGMAAIADTDGGKLDGDPVWDRAVGPMQFIPGTWSRYGVDGNSDGKADPHNIYDAALSAGRYLCSGDLDLREPEQLATAVFRYNHSNAYVAKVLGLAIGYSLGLAPLPELPPLVQRARPISPPEPEPTPAPPMTTSEPPPPAPLPPCPTPTSTTGPRRIKTTTPTTTTEPTPTTTTAPCTEVSSTSVQTSTSGPSIRRPVLPRRTTTPATTTPAARTTVTTTPAQPTTTTTTPAPTTTTRSR
ncbi:lytic transglycosylase domain-containing protein [Allokutzneria sp. NRRL B-24872]|uniref:lytic transglycosylase domain-containing protein n=1 Tax=Allokutzneria sp. NRRL B-24872 TaxID=1137961 RepID=UPI001FEF0A30|nr:lytic transglycosylase domain-containing protein [Allokutzneria sp. NRRL B-24872]